MISSGREGAIMAKTLGVYPINIIAPPPPTGQVTYSPTPNLGYYTISGAMISSGRGGAIMAKTLGVFPIIAPHESIAPLWYIYHDCGAIGFLTTKMGGCYNGKDPVIIP